MNRSRKPESPAEVTERLLAEGLRLFDDAFAKLVSAVEKQSTEGAGKINRLTYTLPERRGRG